MSASKEKDGMGIRELEVFNFALLAKQGWRLMTNPSSVVAKVLQGTYFHNVYFLAAKVPGGASFM